MNRNAKLGLMARCVGYCCYARAAAKGMQARAKHRPKQRVKRASRKEIIIYEPQILLVQEKNYDYVQKRANAVSLVTRY